MKKLIPLLPIIALISACNSSGMSTNPSTAASTQESPTKEEIGILPCSVVSRMIMAKKVSLDEGLQIQCEEDAMNPPIAMKYEKWCGRVTGVPCTGNATGWHDVE